MLARARASAALLGRSRTRSRRAPRLGGRGGRGRARRRPRRRRERPRLAHAALARGRRAASAPRETRGAGRRRLREPHSIAGPAPAATGRRSSSIRRRPGTRLGVLFPVEDDRWMVTLVGWFGDHPPGDEAGFLDVRAQPRRPRLSTTRSATPSRSRRSRSTDSRRTSAATTSGCATLPDGLACHRRRVLQLQPDLRPGHDDRRDSARGRSTRACARARAVRRNRSGFSRRVPAPARAG